jgi:hypothetical protein
MSVNFLSHNHRITEPLGDLEDRAAVDHEEAGEGVAHDMGRDPRHILRLHIRSKRFREIVAIDIFTAADIGFEHEGLAQTVNGEELVHDVSHRNIARLFFIVESQGGRGAKIDVAEGQIEPPRHALDDLIFPQTGVEAAHQNVLQLLGRAFADEFVAQLAIAIAHSRSFGKVSLFHQARGISPNLFAFERVIEQRADRHQMLVRGLDARDSDKLIVISLELIGRNVIEVRVARVKLRPLFQHPFFILSRRARVIRLLALGLAFQVGIDLVDKIRARCQSGINPHILRAFNCFAQVIRFQRNHWRALASDHRRLIPINISAPKNAADFFHRVLRLAKRIAAVNLLQFIRSAPILSRPVHGFDSRTRCSLVKRAFCLRESWLLGWDKYPLGYLRNDHGCCNGLLQRLHSIFAERFVAFGEGAFWAL